MKTQRSIGSGLIGALVLAAVQEAVRRLDPEAPRPDRRRYESAAKWLGRVGIGPPTAPQLQGIATLGEAVSNSLYFGLIGDGEDDAVWLRGAGLGLSAGFSALLAPPRNDRESISARQTPKSRAITVATYLAGGLAAAVAARVLSQASARR